MILNLSNVRVSELRKACKLKNLKGYSKLRKPELIALVNSFMKEYKQPLKGNNPSSDENTYYVYKHFKWWNKEVFYIGMGGTSEGKEYHRPEIESGRNRFWINLTNKHEWSHEILIKQVPFELAEYLEIHLIAHYGRRDLGLGTLVNLTDGGGGIKNPSEKHRQNLSKALTGLKKSKEHLQKISKALTGRKFTDEHRANLRKNHPRTGLGEKIPEGSCLYCGKSCSTRHLEVYHGDKCLEHPDLTIREQNRSERKSKANYNRFQCPHCPKRVTWFRLETEHLDNCKRHPFLQK